MYTILYDFGDEAGGVKGGKHDFRVTKILQFCKYFGEGVGKVAIEIDDEEKLLRTNKIGSDPIEGRRYRH
jgi:hypothetical protein